MATTSFRDIINVVSNWARLNAQDDFYYGAPYSYWRAALTAEIVTQDEYDQAQKHYGHLWTYRGD